eukprot:403371250
MFNGYSQSGPLVSTVGNTFQSHQNANNISMQHSLVDLYNQQKMQPAHQPVPDDEYRVVTLDSPEFRAFIKKIEVNNNESKHKLSACLLCWGFITFYQKRRHQEHSHYTVTPSYFRDEKTFLGLAQKHSKYLEQPDGGVLVGIFAEQCKIIESSYINAPNRSHAFAQSGARNGGGFANQSVSEIRQVSQQQINQENQIKRLNTMITALYEECKIKERRIIEIEEAMIQMQQLVCGSGGNIKPLTMIGSNSINNDAISSNQFPSQGGVSINQQQQQNLIGAFANKPHQVQNKINIAGCSSKQEKKERQSMIKKQKQSNSQDKDQSKIEEFDISSKFDNTTATGTADDSTLDNKSQTNSSTNEYQLIAKATTQHSIMKDLTTITQEEYDLLDSKYKKLLCQTTRLLYKRNKLTKNNENLYKSVKYLKTVFNQHYKQEVKNQRGLEINDMTSLQIQQLCDPQYDGEIDQLSSDDELINKKVFMVEKEREYRSVKKFVTEARKIRQEKEREERVKIEKEMALKEVRDRFKIVKQQVNKQSVNVKDKNIKEETQNNGDKKVLFQVKR